MKLLQLIHDKNLTLILTLLNRHCCAYRKGDTEYFTKVAQ